MRKCVRESPTFLGHGTKTHQKGQPVGTLTFRFQSGHPLFMTLSYSKSPHWAPAHGHKTCLHRHTGAQHLHKHCFMLNVWLLPFWRFSSQYPCSQPGKDGITDSMAVSLSKFGELDGQGGPACCSPWGHEELDTTEWLNWTELTDVIWWSSLVSQVVKNPPAI